MEDLLEKTLRYVGYDVKRVMNITDVGHLSSDADTGEDKMLKGQKERAQDSDGDSKVLYRCFLPTVRSSISRRPMW